MREKLFIFSHHSLIITHHFFYDNAFVRTFAFYPFTSFTLFFPKIHAMKIETM